MSLGFLPWLAQDREYRKDVSSAVELHSRGFVILKRDQWENGVHLPISEFIKVMKKSQQNAVDVEKLLGQKEMKTCDPWRSKMVPLTISQRQRGGDYKI